VFILRFWREEASAGGETQWRAQITDVNAQKRQFVSTVEAAFAVVLARLKATFNGSNCDEARRR
jgi:hypothetical protein